MHNYAINNVKLDNVSVGGYKAISGEYSYISEIHDNGNGSIGWTTRTLNIKNGIIVSA